MRRRKEVLLVSSLVVLAVGWVLLRLYGPATKFAPGHEIQLDDFTFAVTGASPGSTTASNQLYAVKIRVRNHARRVDYTFKPEEVAVLADGAKPLEYLSSSCWGSNTLRPGEVRDFLLTFQGPPRAKELRVWFTFGGPLGTALESLFFGKKVFDVDVS